MDKVMYQTAIGCGIAWLLVAAVEFLEAPGAGEPLITLTIACMAFAVASSMIHRVFWRSCTPYITQEEATILASPEALPAPLCARVWLAVSMLSTTACMTLIVINATYGKPVWSLEIISGSVWWVPLIIVTSAMSQKPFNTMLPPGR